MIVYPTVLPGNGQAFNLASTRAYNPQNDILISLEYCISGNQNTEAGLSFFLLSDATSFSGGVSGTDLCYSGYYNNGYRGINTAIIGLGFDSTGSFGLSSGDYYSNSNPLSGTLSAFRRDGYDENDIKSNSVALRSSRTLGYTMSTFNNYYRSVSSVNLVDSSFESRYLRFRLGNVARTLYLDYKKHFDDVYQPIAVADIGSYLDISEFYRIGIGFTTPVNTNSSGAVANFYFKKIHIEGLVNSLSSLVPLIEVWENILPFWPDITESWSL